MAPASGRATKTGEPPARFRIARELEVGRHPLLSAFPGLDRLPTAARFDPRVRRRHSLFSQTLVELVDQQVWMYVAPKKLPSMMRSRRWKPVVVPNADCVVVGAGHFRDSPSMTLFMDIFHELCHVRQRREGANLWEPGVSYVRRWTELEAYRFVIAEARRRGATDEYLREYLRVEWISDAELHELWKALGVPES